MLAIKHRAIYVKNEHAFRHQNSPNTPPFRFQNDWKLNSRWPPWGHIGWAMAPVEPPREGH
jgi:hypothetical protein